MEREVKEGRRRHNQEKRCPTHTHLWCHTHTLLCWLILQRKRGKEMFASAQSADGRSLFPVLMTFWSKYNPTVRCNNVSIVLMNEPFMMFWWSFWRGVTARAIRSFVFVANDLPAEWDLSQGQALPEYQPVNLCTDTTQQPRADVKV